MENPSGQRRPSTKSAKSLGGLEASCGSYDETVLTGANQNGAHQQDSGKQELQNNRTTDYQTMMHILKANIGTGVLAMPNAFKNVGLWLGFLLIPLIGATCIHCMNILIESHNHLCDRFNYESLDYDQVAALGLACGPKCARRLAKKAHRAVAVFLVFIQLGACCVYVLFVVENIQLAVLNLFNVHYSSTTYLLLVFPVIGLTSCTSNLKHMARVSTLANILQLTGLGLIFYDLLQFHTYSIHLAPGHLPVTELLGGAQSPLNATAANLTAVQSPPAPTRPHIQVEPLASSDIRNGLPLFFATAVYAFEGIGVVLPLIKEMQHPAHISGLNGLLNTAMMLVALLYMSVGFFGYAKYGQYVQSVITLNLPKTTLNEIVRIMFALAVGLSYSLQFYVPWTMVWPYIDESLFYSYRPREPRDKLEILNKLSAENEWAIEECEPEPSSEPHSRQEAAELADPPPTTTAEPEEVDNNSTASTFATSYAVSTYHQQSTLVQRRQVNLSSSLLIGGPQGTSNTNGAAQQYGTLGLAAGGSCRPGAPGQQRRHRNRLEDVAEQEDDLPEVQWRPPPRSMRGKRKLVRYTVILLSVSFTFIAAALIPRLDLFISLIGALASSCLAIIFPAIIQMCTFWYPDESDDDDDDDDDQNHDHYRREDQEERAGDNSPSPMTDSAQALAAEGKGSRRSAGRSRRSLRRKLLWWLSLCKNLLLIVFGLLGLVTGTWISVSQLNAAYDNGA